MVQKIRSVKDVEVITKEGECKLLITLELDLNINLNGTNTGSSEESPKKEQSAIKEETPFIVPDFQTSKIKFGNITKIPKEE
jgi:hypothetical protein